MAGRSRQGDRGQETARRGRFPGHPPRSLALALLVALLAAAGALAGGAGAESGDLAPIGSHAQPGATPDEPAVMPFAAAGTEQAAASSLSRSALRRQLADAMRYAGGHSGAWVIDTGTPSRPVLFSQSQNAARILASNQKLFATATALDRFGAGRRLRTTVYARGQRRGIDDRVLEGNLVVRGDGDPAFGTPAFARRHGLPLTRVAALARKIDAAGIRRITGMVRADDTIFDRRRGIPATGYSPGPYLSPLSGLSFNSGFANRGYAANPELLAARALRRALERRGIRVGAGVGRAALKSSYLSRTQPLAAVRSPALSVLVTATNRPSNNFFAEMLLKRIGGGPARQGTTQRGARRVEAFASSIGTGVEASDGSGLGRGNRASPKQVGKLLRAMLGGGSGGAFRQSLAVAGQSGTLAGRMRGTAAQGRCQAKTGTLIGVSALSGYCNAAGSPLVFAILMNGVDVNRARTAQDRMVTAIARYSR